MYGMTEKGVGPVVEGIKAEGIVAHVHRLPETNVSFVLPSALRSTGIVVAAPTYEYKMFPPVAHVVDDLGRKRVFNRKAFYFGSYGWSGGALKELEEVVERYRMKWDFLEPVVFKGAASQQDLETIYQRGRELAQLVKQVAPAPAAA
jgi:flavorubredoxin